MFSTPSLFYGGIVLAVFLIAKKSLKFQTENILFPLAILNTIPLYTFPMSLTPMYAVDILSPFLVLYAFFNHEKVVPNSYFKICLLLFVVLPVISLIWSVARWTPSSSAWIVILYRKITIFFFVVYCIIKYKDLDIYQIFKTSILYWILLCVVGIGHYLGLYYADVSISDDEAQIDASIFENSWMIQKGFMGLNRGAIGLFSATFLSFCFSSLMFNSEKFVSKRFIYMICILLSVLILFMSGSRSGLIAAIGGSSLSFFYALNMKKTINIKYLIFIVIGVVGVLVYLSSTTLLDRYSLDAAENSGTLRFDVQLLVLENSLSDLQSFLIGNGIRPFFHLGSELTHPHSDYLQTLWDYGWIGLILYFILLKMIYSRLRRNNISINFHILSAFSAALIMGLTVGNLMISSSRLIVYVCFMISIYTLSFMKTEYGKSK